MEDFEKELKLDFLEEATQLLENTEQAFLQLENDLHNSELIDEIFRFAHNLKGTSRAVGFGVVAEFTHEVENLILKLKQNELEINEHVVSVLLECNDHINEMINKLKDDFDTTFDSDHLVEKVKAVLSGSTEETDVAMSDSHSGFEGLHHEQLDHIDTSTDEIDYRADEELINQELLRELEEIEASRAAILETTPVSHEEFSEKSGFEVFKGQKEITVKDEVKIKLEAVPSVAKVSTEDKKIEKDESIRVSLSRVESLNNFVGELVILQSVLEQQKYSGIKDELAIKSIGQLSKLCKEIQDISMSLRMVPVKSTLQKMSRIVRDTSKTLSKTVQLTLKGEETEIDKTVLEHLSDPLVHIVRNAVDHGLESTEERVSSAKDEKGQILIHAYHEGNNLVIDVVDDGKGIDPNIIRTKAIAKGIISADSAMSDYDVIQLIFHPGFSTKDQVSEVSGRGVGMDVVKTNIEKLSGSVNVKTELGKGSTFKIVLPLTMAIIDGMVVQVGESKFVIPITQVQESLKPEEEDIHFTTGLGECLDLRGKVLPVKKVGELLKIKDNGKKLNEQIIIIANGKNGPIAVAVDDIIQQQQVVIKKLGAEIKDQKGFMGSSILGDGKPAFIIDVDDLCKQKSTNSLRGKFAA